jgi:hypothetical protein
MLNPFFLQGSKTEQNLIQDLINEQLKIYGVEIYYIPRKYLTKKTIIKEVIESQFNNAYPIEAYVDTYDGYEGAGTLLTKFGVQPYTDLSLIISKERFETYITPLIKNQPNIELYSRPKEGDLIYFPLGDRLFEIKFVEHEIPFYQLQKTYVYTLRCELFRYEDEIIDTGIDYIDDNIQEQGYIQTFDMIGSGVTATATASIVNGGVTFIKITNRGDGYKTAPQVKISPPAIGQVATGIATLIGGIVDLCEPDSSLYRVQGVEITNSGYGYTTPPTVAFYGGNGKGATAIASSWDHYHNEWGFRIYIGTNSSICWCIFNPSTSKSRNRKWRGNKNWHYHYRNRIYSKSTDINSNSIYGWFWYVYLQRIDNWFFVWKYCKSKIMEFYNK